MLEWIESPIEVATVATRDYSKTRIRIFTVISNSAWGTLEAVRQVKNIAKQAFAPLPEVKVDMSGRPIIMCDTMLYILSSQLRSFGSACLVILVSLIILFRSWKLGLASSRYKKFCICL